MTDEKKLECVKCKEEKSQSDGVMIYEGSTFCCNKCKKEMDKEKTGEEGGTCEFC